MFQAYLITCTVNQKRYIGITSRGLGQRWNEHLYDARQPKSKLAITRAISKYGPENFKIEAICSCNTWNDLCEIEKLLIVQHGTRAPKGYNASDGGCGPFGVKRTPESVEASASKHRGKPCHENTKIAASNFHRGKPKTDNMRAKLSATLFGKPRTEDVKQKIRDGWAARRAAGLCKTSRPYEHSRKPPAP